MRGGKARFRERGGLVKQKPGKIQAKLRADELFEDGDLDGAQTFRLIVHKVNQRQRGPKVLQ
jgi:hypothetical protein